MKFATTIITWGFIFLGIGILLEITNISFLVTIRNITLSIHIIIFILGMLMIVLTIVATSLILYWENREEDEDSNSLMWIVLGIFIPFLSVLKSQLVSTEWKEDEEEKCLP
ncbi:hypothetical protein [Candidatus Uabimicrobium sp. HlEnr_7]|uniref:hypothetical protein n=1 Tax=Candidatus Uabimicrobium helgolandensis TaxID=3095367 RepID=UPI0035567990